MGHIRALGYVRVSVTDIEAWRAFAVDAIGFAVGSGPEEGALYLRVDEHPGRIILVPGDEDRVLAVGWEARDGRALEGARAAVEEAGIEVRSMGQDELDHLRVEGAFTFTAPGGTVTEIFHGMALDHAPLNTAYGNRFVAGELGLGHVVVPVGDIDAAFSFYADVLGFVSRGSFRMPPSWGGERLRFMGTNARHHSLALLPTKDLKAPALVHIMVECETLDEVGRALDRVMAGGHHISATLGRHTNDKMVSFYVMTPGGWDLEVGYDGMLVDDSTYVATEITADSYWGHKPHPDGKP